MATIISFLFFFIKTTKYLTNQLVRGLHPECFDAVESKPATALDRENEIGRNLQAAPTIRGCKSANYPAQTFSYVAGNIFLNSTASRQEISSSKDF